MKLKFVLSLFLLGGTVSMMAQGYQDGIEYYNVNQLEKAKILLERNLNNAGTDKAKSYYYLGMIALNNDNKNLAQEFFNKGVAANPNEPLNYVGLGALDLKNNNSKAAENNFDTAISKDKKNARTQVAIARAYYKANPVTYAKQINKALEKAKKFDKADPYAYILEGDMLAAEKKWGDAAGYYEMAQNFDKNNTEAYVKYANTYFYVNPKIAIQKLQDLTAINPNSALAQRELAEKLYEDYQWTQAAEVYGSYIKNPNHFREDEERYAVLLYFGKKYNESFDLATSILAKNSNSFLMKRLQFLNKAALEQYAEADTYAKTFFGSSDPKNKYSSNDYSTYGDVLKELNRSEESVAMYEKAVEMNPEKIEIFKDISSAYSNKGDHVNAAKFFQKFVDGGNYSTNDLYVLAGRYQNVAATAKNAAEKDSAIANALKYIDIVLEKVPNDYRIPQRKARILMVAETSTKEGKALESYEKMLSILDADPANLSKNADAYKEAYNYIAGHKMEVGDKAGAKHYYNKFLELDPNNKALRDYVEKLK